MQKRDGNGRFLRKTSVRVAQLKEDARVEESPSTMSEESCSDSSPAAQALFDRSDQEESEDSEQEESEDSEQEESGDSDAYVDVRESATRRGNAQRAAQERIPELKTVVNVHIIQEFLNKNNGGNQQDVIRTSILRYYSCAQSAFVFLVCFQHARACACMHAQAYCCDLSIAIECVTCHSISLCFLQILWSCVDVRRGVLEAGFS